MSNIEPVSPSLAIVQRLGIDLIQGTYLATKPIGQAYGGITFMGIDKKTGETVFMKYQIGPRGALDKAKFAMERDALKAITLRSGKVAPKLLATDEFPDIESSAIVMEWVDGELLSDWLVRCAQYGVDDRLAVFARITQALSTATHTYLHRDFHPRNVMLLPVGTVQMGPQYINQLDLIDPGVKILDWGESVPVISCNYDEEPEHHFTMLQLGPRAVGGAFSGLPPEIFKPWVRDQHIAGTYEVWGMAALLYKMLTAKDINAPESIGEYVQQIYKGTLRRIVASRASELTDLKLPGGDIIPRLFEWMCNEDPAERAPIHIVGGVMFDIRYEKLNLFGTDLQRYFRYYKGLDTFTPTDGWRYRLEFERE
jgi:serine/threonine protein kinase